MHETSKQCSPFSEIESIMDKEDDVKVCDICGDAGQEDLLAICSRCIDGAEHTYCMQTMLDKLPVGDWLCEGCKFKEEIKNERAYKFDTVAKIQDESYLNENAQNASSTFYSEILLKKDGGVINLKDKVASRGPQTPKDVLLSSPEDSLMNQDSSIVRPPNPEQSSRSWSLVEGQKAHSILGCISSAGRDGSKVVGGSILKSSSFKNAKSNPKVKQLLGAAPLAENVSRKSISKPTRKGGLPREKFKFATFKTEKGSCNSFELDNEKSSVNITQVEDLKGEGEKELCVTERINSSSADFSDTRIYRGLIDKDNSGYIREDTLHSSGSSASASSNGLNLECQNRCQVSQGFLSHVNVTNKPVNKEDPPHCISKTYFQERRLNPFGQISKECEMKPFKQIFPSIDSCFPNVPKDSVIPKLQFFWQGCFEVLRSGRLAECCDGLQAHFSNYASGKVFEAAKKFPPDKVQLEEVPCLSSWPQQFHGNRAKGHNIALFFFAKDIESYRSSYCKLLDNMFKHDLALKGNFGGFELLIFPSYKLSENSQRWNKLLFLWGIFKGRRSSSIEMLSNVQDDPCISTMDVKSLVEDLPTNLPEATNFKRKNL